MANRFWVGGNGNWDASTTTNWSATSGGAGGASVPTSADSVFVDSNSGSSPVITITAAANCLDLNFTGSITPTLAGSATLNVFGNLVNISTVTWNLSSQVVMAATTTGNTVTTAGVNLVGGIKFFGSGGAWTLQDNLTTSGTIIIQQGTFNSNDKTISCGGFTSSNGNVRTVNLGASSITVTGTWNFTSVINLTFNPGTSTITISSGSLQNFQGGGITYYNVVMAATPTTVSGSNTFNTLTFAAGKTVNLTSGTTQTITSLVCNGTNASPSTLQAVTAGSAATIALPAGRYFIRHTSIKDITITGATAVTSIAGTNVSGNTGITFVTKFEIGRIKNDGSFNWYSTATGTVTKVSG